jgi:hypothetical protein
MKTHAPSTSCVLRLLLQRAVVGCDASEQCIDEQSGTIKGKNDAVQAP